MRAVLVAVATAFAVAIFGTPLVTAILRARGIGQPIHDAVTQHAHKTGTPVMGGVILWVALAVAYLAAQPILPGPPDRAGVVVVGVVVAAGLVGAMDDWLKVRRARNLGLREAQKTIMLLLVAIAFVVSYLGGDGACTGLAVTRCSTLPWDLGPVAWAVGAIGLFWVTTNAVNFADGVEGLLAGSATATFASLSLIAFWQFRHPATYEIDGALQFAVIAASLAAACAGFLWWNGSPGTVFMGDTGSLALGAGIVTLVLSMQVTLLLPVLGILYVAEGASSSLQRYYFRLSGGRRLFKMAPLHHHFEMLGWSEPTIVFRFWIVSGIGATVAAAAFYADALAFV